MNYTSKCVKILYIFLLIVSICLIFNIWLGFINADNTTAIGVYTGSITASILCLKSLKGRKITNFFIIISFLSALLIVFLSFDTNLNWEPWILKALKSVGYGITIGSILVKMKPKSTS